MARYISVAWRGDVQRGERGGEGEVSRWSLPLARAEQCQVQVCLVLRCGRILCRGELRKTVGGGVTGADQ